MSLATITALCLLFLGPWMLHDDWSSVGLFWLPWPIGGVLCGKAHIVGGLILIAIGLKIFLEGIL